MAAHNDCPSPDEAKVSTATPTSSTSTMKLPQMFRRGSAMSVGERCYEKDTRTSSAPEPERRSSLATLPLRLRRRKTQSNTRNEEHEVEAAERLGALFFSLPSEILAQIITYFTINDVYNLRLSSHMFNHILNSNATLITRSCLPERLPETAKPCVENILYPVPLPNLSLSHFLCMVRRQSILDKQIYHLLAFVQMKIYMARTGMDTRILSVNENRHRLIEAFQRPSWIVNHFLENYREIVLHKHPHHQNNPNNISVDRTRLATRCSSCEQCVYQARKLVATYPSADIMPAYHFHQLLLEHLQLAIRAPIAAGNIERRLRGWSKAPATEQSLAVFFILGGIPEIRKVAMMQGSYGSRLSFVNEFMEKVREAIKINEILENSKTVESGSKKVNSKLAAKAEAAQREREKKSSGSNSTTPTTSRSSSLVTTMIPTQSDPAPPLAAEDLSATLSPPPESLTQARLDSLPDLNTFFYDIWRERIDQLDPDEEDISSPYPWLQRVMTGSGVEFGERRPHEPSLALGASPV